MKLSALRPPDTTPPPADPTPRPSPKPWADIGLYRNNDAEIVIDFPTRDDMEQEFRRYVRQVIEHRREVGAHATELGFLSAQLKDPDLADHPKRSWAVKRRERLVTLTLPALCQLAVQTSYAHVRWIGFEASDRAARGMEDLVGVPAETANLAEVLFLIRDGPIQAAAPLPHDWEPPPEFFDCLQVDLLMRIGVIPF